MDNYGTISNVIRGFLVGIDGGFYSLAGLILQLIFEISDVTINFEMLKPFVNRMYFVLTVYMLFKMAIILLTSIANPEKLTDSKVGMGKFAQRVITVFLLLAFVPTIFSIMYRIQPAIIKTLPQLILGTPSGTVEEDLDKRGETMALNIMSGFFEVNDMCKEPDEIPKPGSWQEAGVSDVGFSSLSNTVIKNSCVGVEGIGKTYEYKYSFFISTAAALIMMFVLLGFVIDVSIRLIKLALLQIISPLSIITYIDPAMDKNGAFNNWMKEVSTTYLDIFIKLSTMYFMVYLISEIFVTGESIFIGAGSAKVTIALALGLLLFAKTLPKYIMQIFGVKSSSGVGLGVIGAGMGGALGGMISGGIGGAKAGGFGGAITGALGGGFTGGFGGLQDGIGGAATAISDGKQAQGGIAGFMNQSKIGFDPTKADKPNIFQRQQGAQIGSWKGFNRKELADKKNERNLAYDKMNELKKASDDKLAALQSTDRNDSAAYLQAQHEYDTSKGAYESSVISYQQSDADYNKYSEDYKKYGGGKTASFEERMYDVKSGFDSTMGKMEEKSIEKERIRDQKKMEKSGIEGTALRRDVFSNERTSEQFGTDSKITENMINIRPNNDNKE